MWIMDPRVFQLVVHLFYPPLDGMNCLWSVLWVWQASAVRKSACLFSIIGRQFFFYGCFIVKVKVLPFHLPRLCNANSFYMHSKPCGTVYN
jgi:hypothetical protein